jgi:hypothetical protein
VRITSRFLFAPAALALIACANGSELAPGFEQTGEGGAGEGGTGGAITTSSSSTGAGGAGGEGGEGGAGQGGGGTCEFDAPKPCTTGDVLVQIRGDAGNDLSTANGITSRWFHIYVSESVSDPLNFPQLSYTATLSSPPGMDYDLYVYTGDDQGPNCQDTPVKGTGNPETVTNTWGDTIAVEDGTWLALEVRYVSGSACDPQDDDWTLAIEGHTDP